MVDLDGKSSFEQRDERCNRIDTSQFGDQPCKNHRSGKLDLSTLNSSCGMTHKGITYWSHQA